MSNKNPTLFGKEWNFAPPALDENNLVEEDKKDEDIAYEDYLKALHYNPGQTTSHLVDKDKNERVLKILEKGPRSKVHYGADDVDDLIARNQSAGQKWLYGVAKTAPKIISMATGGVAMLPSIVGVTGDWLIGGHEKDESWSDIWDNDFQRSLEGFNEWLDKELPHYYTKEEQERAFYKNILGSGAANFWTNDVANGLAFVAGAVLSEVALTAASAATWGAAAPALIANSTRIAAQAARIIKGLSRGKALTNSVRGTKVAEKFYNTVPKLASKIKAGGLLSRRLVTGAGYEAGVEARHHVDSVHKTLKGAREFELGRPLTEKENADIYDEAMAHGNAVFAANLALVGVGNLVAFPRIFGAGYRATARQYGDIMKTIGKDMAAPYQAAYKSWSTSRNALNTAYHVLKRPMYEGIVEEGGQSWLDIAGQHSAADYYMKGKRPNSVDAIKGLISGMYHTAEENFTSNETQKEMGIGFILGALGLPTYSRTESPGNDPDTGKPIKGKRRFKMMGGSLGSYRDMQEMKKKSRDLAKYANENPDAFQALKANYDLLVKHTSLNEEQDVALATNNMFAWKNAKDDQFFNYVRSRTQAGFYEDVIDDINAIRNMPNKEFAENFGYEELTDDEISTQKDKVIESALRKAELIKKSIKTVDNIYKGDNDAVMETMAHALSSVELVGEREESIYNEVDELTKGKLNLRVSEEVNQMLKDAMGSGSTSIGRGIDNIKDKLKKDSQLEEGHPNKMSPSERTVAEETLKILETGMGELEYSNAVDDMFLMNKWQTEDPQGYEASPHRAQIRQMLSDLRKLRERRQDAIRMYNELNTVEGENTFNENIEYYANAYEEERNQKEEKAAEEAVKNDNPADIYDSNPEAELWMKHPKTGEKILVRFKNKDYVEDVESGTAFSSKLLKTNFIGVSNSSIIQEDLTPISEDISPEFSTEDDDFFTAPRIEENKKPDFIDVGFGKTAGWLNTRDVDSMSESQKNFFKYIHKDYNADNVELELVTSNNNKYDWLDFYKDIDGHKDIKAVVVNKKSGTPKKFNGQYIYTSIMLPTMKSSTDKERFSGMQDTPLFEEYVKEEIEKFEAFRKAVEKGNVRVPIEGRSRIYPKFQGYDERYGVTERIIGDRKQLAEAELKIATSDMLSVDGHNYKVNPGKLYIIYNNSPVPLYDRTLNEQEVETIIELLKMYSENKLSEDPNISTNPDQILGTEIGRDENLKIIDAVRGIIRFGNYKAGVIRADGTPAYNPEYHINLDPNGIRLKGSEIITFKSLKEGDAKALESLSVFLANKIHDVNNNFLKNNDPYYHVVLNKETGLDIQEYTNYKEYLLANREDDLDIPYTTNLVSKSEDGDTDAFQHDGGYLMFNIPTKPHLIPSKKKTRTKTVYKKKFSEVRSLGDALSVGTSWSLEGLKDGKIRQAKFDVVSKEGVITLLVPPGQDELMTAWVEEVLQPGLKSPGFTLRQFHSILKEEYELTTDAYNKVKPDLIQLDPEEVNPFEEVKDKVSNVRKEVKKQKPKVTQEYKYDYKGIPVYENLDIKTKEKTPGIAKRTKDKAGKDIIYINSNRIAESFKNKQWTKPRKLKDGSSAIPLPRNTFKNKEEWEKFILEHEYQHTKIKQKKKETSGEYEDRINIAASKVLKTPFEPPKDMDWGRTSKRRNKGDTKTLDAQRKLKDEYKKINIEAEREWFEGKFNIPFNTMKGLVSGSNYGEFRQLADVMVSEMAIQGTTYHEAFHVVHDYFWTPEEKIQLYRDYKKYTNQPNISNAQIEEELAEEFRHYMLKDGLSIVPPVKGLKAWFKKIWDFIKSLGRAARFTVEGSRLSNLFEAIRTSDYRAPQHSETALLNRFTMSLNPKTKNLEGANVLETKEILEGFINSVFDELYKEESDLHIIDLLELPKNVDITAEFGVLMDNGFANMMGVLRSQIEEELDDGTWVRREDWTQENQDKIYENAKFIQENKSEIYSLFEDWIESKNINIELELNEAEAKKENNYGATHQHLETSARGSASAIIKLLIASLPNNNTVGNAVGLYGLVDYKNVFDSLQNELAGIQNFADQVEAIEDIAQNRPDLADPLEILLERIKANHSPSNLSVKDMSLRVKFEKQFDKNNNTYYLNIIKEGSAIHTTDSNVTKTESIIANDWQNNFRGLAQEGKGFLKINEETGGVIIDPKKKFKLGPLSGITYKTLPNLGKNQVFNFLELIGINFTNKSAIVQNSDVFNELIEQTSQIKKFFLDKQAEDLTLEVESLFKSEDTGVAARINKLVAIERPYYTNTIELQHKTPDNKTAYGVTLGNFLSRVSNDLSNGNVPQYIQDAEEVMRGSQWLDHVSKGGGIKIVILEGASIDESGFVGKVTKDLTYVDRDAMYIHNTLNGRYPLLQASEKKTVFGFELFDKNGRVGASKINRNKSISTLLGHLTDEIQVTLNLIRDNKGRDIAGFGTKIEGGIAVLGEGSRLRTFAFLNEQIIKEDDTTLLQLLQDKNNTLTANEIVAQYISILKPAIENNIFEAVGTTMERLKNNGMIVQLGDGMVDLYGVDAETFGKTLGINKSVNNKGEITNYKQVKGNKLNLTSTELANFIEAFELKDRIAGLEQLKLFFGDVGFFTPNSLYKRTAGPHGVKKFASIDPVVNDWLRQNIERYDKKLPDNKVRAIVFRDVKAKAQFYNEYRKILGDAVTKPYLEYIESDAQGYITIDEYIEFLFRTSDITEKHLELYQKVQEGEQLTSEEMIYFTPLKPQYYGPTESQGLFHPAYYKLSLAVLLPQMLQRFNPITGIVESTTLKRLHDDMVKHQAGIAVFESGVKIGSKVDPKTGLHQQFYGRGGRYPKSNIKPVNIQTLYYDYLGIQVDMGTKVKDKAARGVQRVALVLANLYDKGKAVSPWAQEIATKYANTHTALTYHNFNNFTYKLGFDEHLDQVDDIERIKSALRDEVRQRKLDDNELKGLEILLASEDKFLELVSNKPKLDNVLHSLFARDVIAKKYFGGSYAQVASTGMEFDEDGRTTVKATKQKDHMYGAETNPLNFYKLSKDGKEVLGMEVMLPHYFKEFLGNNVKIIDGNIIDSEGNIIGGPDLLNIVGFRIPTSAINSIEAITIKGFLPKEAGEAVMMPSEIVVKAGSDYDIDKLTIMFPNYTVVREGGVKRLIKIPYLDENVSTLEKVKALRRYDKITYKRMIEVYEGYSDLKYKEIGDIQEQADDVINISNLQQKIQDLKTKVEKEGMTWEEFEESDDIHEKAMKDVEGGLASKADELFRKYFDTLEDILNKNKKELFDIYNSDQVKVLDGKIDILKTNRANAKTSNEKNVISREIENLILDKLSITSGHTIEITEAEEIFEEMDQALADSEYFKALPSEHQNAVPALQNREVDITRRIITHPSNYEQLIKPVGAPRLKGIARSIAEDTGIPIIEEVSFNEALHFSHKQEMAKRFWEGMEALGVAALENTSHIKLQPFNLLQIIPKPKGYALNEIVEANLLETEVLLTEGQPEITNLQHSLSHSKDINNEHYINEILGEFITAFVDVANEPFVYGLNANMETINTLFTLLRKGGSIDTISRFLMQPILREYIAELPKTKSFILPESKRFNLRNRLINKYKRLGDIKKLEIGPGVLTREDLQEWLTLDPTNATRDEIQEFALGQILVLDLYENSREDALDSSEFTKAISYDNKAPMNRIHAKLKQIQLNKFIERDSATGNKLGINNFIDNSWMSEMVSATEDILPLLKGFYLTDDNIVINTIIKNMSQLLKYNSEQDVIKTITTAENDFVTFLFSGLLTNEDNGKILGDELSSLTQGPNSVARRWREFSRENPTNLLVKELSYELQLHKDPNNLGYSHDVVRAFARNMSDLEANLLSESFMELYNGSIEHKTLAKDLVKLAIVQAGMNKSPETYMRIIPPEIYSIMSKEVLDKYKVQRDNINEFRFYDQFYRNNWNNDLIVPSVKPKITYEDSPNIQYPRMVNNQLEVQHGSYELSHPYLKIWVADPSISTAKRKRLERAGKKVPFIANLYKRPYIYKDEITVKYKQVGRLGDGFRLKEYSFHPDPASIIPLNNFMLRPNKAIKAAPVVDKTQVDNKVLEGDIFSFEGVPVIPINLEGVHSEGIAKTAKQKGLLQEKLDNDFVANNSDKTSNFNRGRLIITLPIQYNADSPIDLGLVEEGLKKIRNIATNNPKTKILVPLLQGDVNTIVPILRDLINTLSNISIVLPSNNSLTDKGIEKNIVIKKMLDC